MAGSVLSPLRLSSCITNRAITAKVRASTRAMVFQDQWAPSDDEAEQAAMAALEPSLVSAEHLLYGDDDFFDEGALAAVAASPTTPRLDDSLPKPKGAPQAAGTVVRTKSSADAAEDAGISPDSPGGSGEDVRSNLALMGLAPWAPPVGVEVKRLLCVVGGTIKVPVVVRPHSDRAGKEWIIVNEHLPWLRRALGASGSTHWNEALQSAVSAMRAELRSKLVDARQSTSAAGQQRQLRAQLQLDDAEEPKAKSARRAKGDKATNILTVTFEGVEMQMMNSARPLAVSASPESLDAMVRFCRAHITKGAFQLKGHKRQKPAEEAVVSTPLPADAVPTAPAAAFQMPSGSCPAQLGKITWHPSATAWAAHWKDSNGQRMVTRFTVKAEGTPVHGLLRRASGQGDERENFADKRQRRYEEAVTFWNENDKSKRERIAMPDTSSAPQVGSEA